MDSSSTTPLRLAELIGGLSLACDVASGFPPGKVLRTVVIATRVARLAGLDPATQRDTFFMSLLRYLGCTGFSHEEASEYGAGDDIGLRNVMAMADAGDPAGTASAILSGIGRGASFVARGAAIARLLGDGQAVQRHARAQCETSAILAKMVGASPALLAAISSICERWDGLGAPRALRGEALESCVRLHHLADGAEIAWHRAGAEAARALVARRAGGWLDPALAAVFLRESEFVLADLDGPELWSRYLKEEPQPWALATTTDAHNVARAFGHLADLKSAYTIGHSARVAELARAAGSALGLGQLDDLELAGLLHDLGRLSVPNSVWDRPGPLGHFDWERVRLHSYYSERVLSTAPVWRRLAPLVSSAHEQPSGAGYHRARGGPELSLACRVLAAADAVAAMSEPRAHRPALDADASARELDRDVARGKLDKRAAEAVLTVSRGRRPAKIGAARALSAREAEVLRLVARGKTNREIGSLLGISARTVQVHVAHVYDKIGVESRAGAALFAVEHQLLDEPGGS